MLDVRPITLKMQAASQNPECASNVVSFRHDDGTSFIGEPPPVSRVTRASLRFPIDRVLADGVLFIPNEMEHKWAVFYHGGEVICVQSWQRKVQVVARLDLFEHHAEVTEVRGTFGAEDEDPVLTVRLFDYLLRSHALDTAYPAPLPAGMEENPEAAAMWCMAMFGNRALFATPHRLERRDPERPLRTHSLLHIATARGQVPEIEAHLAAGVPVDLLAGDGKAPLHWALACEDSSIMRLLLERGSQIDVRSSNDVTPLMSAVQSSNHDKVLFLLEHGADVNARDRFGFTSLHRAAEWGEVEILQTLLEHGAAPGIEAQGETARSIAEARHNHEILEVLNIYK